MTVTIAPDCDEAGDQCNQEINCFRWRGPRRYVEEAFRVCSLMMASSTSEIMTSSEESTASSIRAKACHIEFSEAGLRFRRTSTCACCGGGTEQSFLPWKSVKELFYTAPRCCRPSALKVLDVNAKELVARAVGEEDFEKLNTTYRDRAGRTAG